MAKSATFTAAQLQELIRTITEGRQNVRKVSMTSCPVRYDGSRNRSQLESFIAAVDIFKTAEGISDESALRELQLLFDGEAAKWWLGIKATITSWKHALDDLRYAFAPRRPAYLVYKDIILKEQGSVSIDEFVADKRLLFAELPINSQLSESMKVDLIYGQLRALIRERVPREGLESLSELITKARLVEECEQLKNSQPQEKRMNGWKKTFCGYCRMNGHTTDACGRKPRKWIAGNNTKIVCYGCGKQGVTRHQCTNCNPRTTHEPPEGVASFVGDAEEPWKPRPRPVIPITIGTHDEIAYLDTGAKMTIASRAIYRHLVEQKVPMRPRTMNIEFADGKPRVQEVQLATTTVLLYGRFVPTTFVILKDTPNSHTLLGVDFIQDAGLIVNMPQRTLKFFAEPRTCYSLLNEENILKGRQKMEPLTEKSKPRQEIEISPRSLPQWLQMVANNGLLEEEAPSDIVMQDIYSESKQLTPKPPEKEGVYAIGDNDKITNSAIAANEKAQLQKVLNEMEKVFTPNTRPTSQVEHTIITTECIPVSSPPYRLSPVRTQELRRHMAQMLQDGIIETSESAWASPVVMVPKKDGSTRICVDYRKLNALTISDAYPLPRMDDLLHNARQARVLTTLDLRAGYWQVGIRQEDRCKTAFITPFGLYQFKRMPFGLKNAPATFQRLIDRMKIGIEDVRVLAYLDDIVILSETFEQHLKDLVKVFKQLLHFGLKVNREKCRFCCSEVRYLGHIISSEGISTDPMKVSAIRDMAPPKNVKQVQTFLQTCSWYRRFVPEFAAISRPLSDLTKKNATWQWQDQQRQAFNELKQRLIEAPILRQADESRPFTIKTDASGYALGAVLVQGEGPEEHPVEYASRLLTPPERNYSTTEREALAVVWAVNKFRGYIEGSTTTISTDHQALKWLMTIKSPTGRLARWALQLQPYDINIKYVDGRINKVADTLSRPPIDEVWPPTCSACAVTVDFPTRSVSDIRAEQMLDEDISTIIKSLENPEPNEDSTYWSMKGYLVMSGMLYRYNPDIEEDDAQLVVPRHELTQILQEYHDAPTSGHYGAERTYRRIAQRYYWKGMRAYITNYTKNCAECQRYKATNQKPAGLLMTSSMNQRFETISFDLFGPLPTTRDGNNWIFIVEDNASRWIELFALKTATAEQCAQVLINEICLRYGTPRRFVSDNGTQFISAVLQQVTHCMDISHSFTPVYHPEANPVERKNRDLKAQLAILVKDKHAEWSDKLPGIRFAMNTAYCQNTGHTAAYLTFGRELRTPDDVTKDWRAIIKNENFIPDITPKLLQLEKTLRQAREVGDLHQDKQKKYADKHRRPSSKYNPGDHVLVATHPLSKAANQYSAKFAPKRDGPYVILKKKGTTSYEIANIREPTKVIGVYHASALTPFKNNIEQVPDPVRPIKKRGRPRKHN